MVALAEYGRLYNWHAVNDSRSLCPEGWHVPTENEFYALGSALGGYPVAGEKMKTTSGWNYNGQGTNTSGFSGPPGGKRSESSGYFSLAGENAFFWTSTPYASLARYRELKFNSDSSTLPTPTSTTDTPSAACRTDPAWDLASSCLVCARPLAWT